MDADVRAPFAFTPIHDIVCDSMDDLSIEMNNR